ncbi:NFX1-type zinc finger-containing protein 1 [Trichodelitschia bisporula]|uniref:NFX1-type zinc finger-containing protein 1 n=1 Tax=Trichodelitschia bisporula TaxID=703511 RepID=A0A6G1HNX4_9PEZI|nr:NFX1-type zinc finger-containing protein 1 [Trichodelitschia bisporula]
MAPGARRGSNNHNGRSTQRSGVCNNVLQGRECSFGARCKYSHDVQGGSVRPPRPPRPEPTAEQEAAKDAYHAWKRLIKAPPTSMDLSRTKRVWDGALDILNADNRDSHQKLPRDLDLDETYGHDYILAVLTMHPTAFSPLNGVGFMDIVHPFLLVITHTELIDSLSLDTYVGAIYNFISGPHGSRAIPFFKRVALSLKDHLALYADKMIGPLCTALCVTLRREPRTSFQEELSEVLDILDGVLVSVTPETKSIAGNVLEQLHAIARRAQSLLGREEELEVGDIAPTASTYPRNHVVPGGRHDNDFADITQTAIFPSADEIRYRGLKDLPSTDRDESHHLSDPAERHIDTLFRLLRHDIFGELKDALNILLHDADADPRVFESQNISLGNIRAQAYTGARVAFISPELRQGFDISISFTAPKAIRKLKPAERQQWWEHPRRLSDGTLLCFLVHINGKSELTFLTAGQKSTDPNQRHSLMAPKPVIVARSLFPSQFSVELLVQLSCSPASGLLIDFSGVLPATFVPVLETLQRIQKESRLSFRSWVLPERVQSGTHVEILDVPPPVYTRNARFAFSLAPILKDSGDELFITRDARVDDEALVSQIVNRTGLDMGQAKALIAALVREFTFIQGPPGCGKTHLGVQLMQVLLHAARKGNLGPIIVVCYTNHALDQFLEHLIQIGITKIIRMGGQSRSPELEGKNLRVVTKAEGSTGFERFQVAKIFEEIQELSKDVEVTLKRLSALKRKPQWSNLSHHLRRHHSKIYKQFVPGDTDWTLVGDAFDIWKLVKNLPKYTDGDHAPIESVLVLAEGNVNEVSPLDRVRLVQYWVDESCKEKRDHVYECVREAEQLRRQLDDVRSEADKRILASADVIGVTTTGLAKRIAVLQHVKAKVVLCEEAAEVMEPHMVSAFLPSVEHFIQIGDHQQLRPQINNYSLSLESDTGVRYQLDRSQFERLCKGERDRPLVPVAQLNVQRRMRPEISTLIRETVYKRLQDHASTQDLPNVVGMRKNVFWLDHSNLEGEQDDQRSHCNVWEVEMVKALVLHIVRQGAYKSQDIAVLTPYTGQLQKLRAAMKAEFEVVLSDRDQDTLLRDGFDPEASDEDGPKRPLEKKRMVELLRLATVDNFQGEEAKLVIVSLVRSNRTRRVGFLRTENRINVLLSRAQHGLYLIGNSDTYANVPMWARVLGMLRATDSVSTALGLCCPRHPDTEIQVSQSEDFRRKSPEGGCELSCDRRLSCGHQCEARCHSDYLHQVFSCPQPCQRLHTPCNHPCQKATCGEDCGSCQIKIDNVQLPCGHDVDGVACHRTQKLDAIFCPTLVNKTVPRCSHVIKIACSKSVSAPSFKCPTPCSAVLECGHPCPGTCDDCRQVSDAEVIFKHASCPKICGRSLPRCNHSCQSTCHAAESKDCGLCHAPCEVRCKHSKCSLKCHEPCAPCIEKRCSWQCVHKGACTLPCGAPCNRLPCQERCAENLACGHRCPTVCGEDCPEGYCQACSDKLDARVDILEMKTYGEIDLDETPIVVLGCGHFFTFETLDGLVGMRDVYEVNAHGEYIRILESPALADSIPRCPDCRSPFRQFATTRYNRVVNRAVIDEMTKRFLISSRAEHAELEAKVDALEESFAKAQLALKAATPMPLLGRKGRAAPSTDTVVMFNRTYVEATPLVNSVDWFCAKVEAKNEPVRKLHDAIVQAARESQPLDEKVAGMKLAKSLYAASRESRIIIGSQLLRARIRFTALAHQLELARIRRSWPADIGLNVKSGSNPAKTAPNIFAACEKLIGVSGRERLPKFAVEATLHYAQYAHLLRSYRNTAPSIESDKLTKKAKGFVEQAIALCDRGFQNADKLREALQVVAESLNSEWYEEVTAEEIAAIKNAMVTGRGGLPTHSGHWYECQNGHAFAVGECGMPMELARCPECGAQVGGQRHNPVAGVARAQYMEDD